MERQFSQKIINFQSDFGGEFQALRKYFTGHGISHCISCPHTLAHNGTAERKHRHIIEIALSLMQHSSVPNKFWDEVVCIAVYLINRLPTPNMKNKSPYHLIYSQEPDYQILKSFRCACYPCLRPYISSKLNSRSERCLFLGYSAFHSGYRCLSLSSSKLYISCDVIFMENIYPYKEPSTVDNSDTQLTIGLLGSSPTHTHRAVSPTDSSSVTPTSPKNSDHLPISLEPHNSSLTTTSFEPHIFSHSPSPTKNPPEFSTTCHILSQNPLSPSNLDSHNVKSQIKTRRLSDIFKTLDSVNPNNTSKFRLPTGLHVSLSIPLEPTYFTSVVKQPEWVEAMQNEFKALIDNKTWKLVLRPLNRPLIGCKWI